MATTLAEKLRITENDVIKPFHAPVDLKKKLSPLPAGASIDEKAKKFNQVHWFVTNRADMEKEMDKVLGLLQDGVRLWIFYPKKTSSIQTDLTRDKGWEKLLAHEELMWVNLISFDETWSAFSARLKTAKDKLKKEPAGENPIHDYADAKTKTVKIPGELALLFKKHKTEAAMFNGLAFSHRKEYIEWIMSAKKAETRKKRLAETIARLGKGWKNPSNN
jgi:hypothetical protein